MLLTNTGHRLLILSALAVLIMAVTPLSALAQGSIYGAVQNSDLSTPANGDISFFGFLDDTDEEVRIETSTGAGYDAGNWFDDFQNYLTEAPNNPYDYYFVNVVNGEGFHLEKLIPNNSFQQEDILLAAAAWPAKPAGLTASGASGSTVIVSWTGVSGLTYHVYRRVATSSGSFFRIDNPAGNLADPGVADSFFVDNTVDGVSSYDYLIIAEDGSGNLSQHSDVITASSATVSAPVVNSIDPTEGLALGGTAVSVYGSGFDPAGVEVLVGAAALTGVTVVSPFHITGTTQSNAAGAVDVVVTNTASALASSPLVGSYTYVSNSYPVLQAIGPQNVVEGVPLAFVATASDVDGGFPVMTSSALPPGASYVDNGDGTGSFNWTPTYFDDGIYNVTFYATDDVQPSLVDSEQVVITVTEAGNQLPVLTAIGPQNATEDVLLTFGVTATDIESTPVLSTSTLPTGAAFSDNLDGTGSFTWTPDFTQAGSYDVTFYATDDSAAIDSEIVTITVNDAGNQAPVLDPIGAQAVSENANLNFGVSASDPDATIPVLSTSTLPTGAVFTDNLDGTGTFDWTPDFTQAGPYDITFYADDGALIDSEIVTITVNDAGNQSPVLDPIGPQAATEDVNLNFGVSASDPDATIPVLSTSTLPTGAVFTDNLDGTGTFDWTPDFTQAGPYDVTFYADDGALIDSEIVTITVADAGNQSPVLDPIGPQATTEAVNLSFGVSASDPDATIPVLTTSALPTGAIFTDNLDGTGTFDWTPGFTQAGPYDVTFYASDGVLIDSEIVTITVNDAGNQSPVLDPIGPQATTEDVNLNFGVTASDPDATIPLLTTSALPTGAVFTDNVDGTGTFDWTPDFTQAGSYDITFYADDGALIDSEIVTITVNEVGNQAPVLDPIGPLTVDEGVNLNVAITSADPDGTIPILTTTALPTGAIFTDNLDGTGTFDWTPDFTQGGSYDVTFYAADGEFIDSELVTITVTESGNQAPVIDPIGPQSVIEGVLLNIAVSASDPDTDIPTLTTSALPTGATFVDNLDGTGAFDWTPDYTQEGAYDVTFFASDGALLDSEIVTITVTDAGNHPPVLDSIGARAAVEGFPLVVAVTSSDSDGTIPALATSALPAGAVFTDNLDGSGLFEWTPDFLQSGAYQVTFYADDGEFIDSEIVDITVSESGDQPPVISPLVDTSVYEGDTLQVVITASDPEGVPVGLTISTGLRHYSFVDSGNGVAVLEYRPDYFDAGDRLVRIFATELAGTGLTSSATFTISTLDFNQPPAFDSTGPFTAEILDTLVFTLVVTDTTAAAGSEPVFLTVIDPPLNSWFNDNGDNTGTFYFAPDFGQEGVDTVSFRAVDQGTPPMSATYAVEITVVTVNLPPVLAPIGPHQVLEGDVLVLNLSATDPDNVIPPAIVADSLPENATLVDNLDGTAVFTFSPNFIQAGLYRVTFAADDGLGRDEEIVLIQVTEAGNQPPAFDPLPSPSVTEGQVLTDIVTAYDPDTMAVTIEFDTLTLPDNFTWIDSGNGVASFTFSPDFTQAGIFAIGVSVSDGDYVTSTDFTITVIEAGNQPPSLSPVFDQFVTENENLQFIVAAYDPDGAPPILSSSPLPGTATFSDDNFDGIGDFDWTPGYDDSGAHVITFYAADADDPAIIDSLEMTITVADFNRTPWFLIPPFQSDTVSEGGSLTYNIIAWDDDGPVPAIGLTVNGLAGTVANMSFDTSTTSDQRLGHLTFNPDYTQGDDRPTFYYVKFQVYDAVDPSIVVESETVTIRVFNANKPPYMQFSDGTGPFVLDEGGSLSFGVQAFDDDGTATLSVENLPPANALVNQPTADILVFDFSPDYTQAGSYQLRFIAVDNGLAADTQLIDIDVLEAGNQAPVWSFILPDTVDVFATISFDTTVSATDPEGQAVTVDGSPVVRNAAWLPNGSEGTYVFAPEPDQIDSLYEVTFTATDDQSLTSTMTTVFRVNAFMRGDTDANSMYSINDVIVLAGYIFRASTDPNPMEAGDVDLSGTVTVADVAYMVNFLYNAGPRPPQ